MARGIQRYYYVVVDLSKVAAKFPVPEVRQSCDSPRWRSKKIFAGDRFERLDQALGP